MIELLMPSRPPSKPAKAPSKSIITATIDEYGELERRIEDEYKPLVARRNKLRDTILSWYEQGAPDQRFTESGEQFDLEVGPCANERTIFSMPKLFKRLGAKLFFQLCKVSLTALDQHVAPVDQKDFVKTEQTGSRRVTATPKAQPKAA